MKNDEGSPMPRRAARRKITFVTAVAVVAAIGAMLAMVLSVSGRPSGSTPTAASTPTTTWMSPTERSVGSTVVPTVAPTGVNWQLYHTVALPYSPTSGPWHVSGSTATGYADTPTGALLAACQIPIRKLLAPDWQQVAAEQIVASSGRTAFVTARAQIPDDDVDAEGPGDFGQYAGFLFANYTPDEATVELVDRFASGTMQVSTVTVEWVDGDWRELLQPDGSDSPSVQAVQNLLGYIEWGGAS